MSKKNIIISVIIILIIAGFLFLNKRNSEDIINLDELISESEQEQLPNLEEQEDRIILKQGFSILMPQGWVEKKAPLSVSLLAVDNLNTPTDERARQINFSSYYTVTLDSLDDVRDEQEYIVVLKKTLEQQVSNVVFSNERSLEINANSAQAIEMDINDNEIDFKTLILVVKGKGNDIWVISFSSTKSDWEKNALVFKKIAKSFLVR